MMTSDREKLESETLSQLADRLQPGPTATHQFNLANAELMRRQAIWQQEASEAQKQAVAEQRRAADAAVETAAATRRSARYMLASVIVLAIASALTLAVNIYEMTSKVTAQPTPSNTRGKQTQQRSSDRTRGGASPQRNSSLAMFADGEGCAISERFSNGKTMPVFGNIFP
jgi:hypothetical protein